MRTTTIGLLGTLAVLLAAGPALSTGTLRKIPLVQLEIRSLSGNPSAAPESLTLSGDRPSKLVFETEFGEAQQPARVTLSARAEPAGDEGASRLLLQATVTLPDGRRIESSRELILLDRKTILFELYREGDWPLTLAIVAELSETWEVIRAPIVGAPVRLDVEVQRIEAGETIRLERNMLHTFEGATVQYSFRRGDKPEDEALTLNLTPVRLIGDLIEIEIEVFGKLPDGAGITMIGRTDHLVASRGVSSPVTVVVGDPPTGYRFLVTPRF